MMNSQATENYHYNLDACCIDFFFSQCVSTPFFQSWPCRIKSNVTAFKFCFLGGFTAGFWG